MTRRKAYLSQRGDANDAIDPEPVQFNRLIGEVTLCVPNLAEVSDYVNSTTGKAVAFIAFALAFILWIVADLLAPKKKNPRNRHRGLRPRRKM